MQQIMIDIAENGDVTIEGVDIVGPECKTLTAEIEKALGVIEKTTTKPAFHRTVAAVARKAGA